MLKHIKAQGLWSAEGYGEWLSERIENDADNIDNYMERGMWHYRHDRWGEALNDFNRVLARDAEHVVAREMADMARNILSFRYTDIYNP